jgi:L-ascorbate metabolism protein UlaG (beta-lactamase superfamily)
MRYTLLRNATALLDYGGRSVLIDPMLDPAGARPAIPNTPNARPNPLVELPGGWQQAVNRADALLVTHLHQDHFDDRAAQLLDKGLPLLCQPEDVARLADLGFTNLRLVDSAAEFDGISVERTAAQHGAGTIAEMLAPVSGFVLTAPGEPSLYIAGDTIWYPPVQEVLERVRPGVVIVNAGGARFLEGEPIVMTVEDVAEVHRAAPNADIIVVHLEAINHCLERRSDYAGRLPTLDVSMDRIHISADGERFELSA